MCHRSTSTSSHAWSMCDAQTEMQVRGPESAQRGLLSDTEVFIAVEKAIMSYYDLSYRYKYEVPDSGPQVINPSTKIPEP